mgnify:FL=1
MIPIQTYLYRVVASASSAKTAVSVSGSAAASSTVSSTSLQYATMVVTTAPVVCVYPFLQKHFVKGMMIGSIKG